MTWIWGRHARVSTLRHGRHFAAEVPSCSSSSFEPVAAGTALQQQQLLRTPARRGYAFQAGGSPGFDVFNRRTKWLQKERAAANVAASRQVDYLKDEVAMRLCRRLLDIKRTFPRALDFGANSCNIARALVQPNPEADTDGVAAAAGPSAPLASRIEHLVAAESSPTLLFRDADLPFNRELSMSRHVMSVEEEEAGGGGGGSAAGPGQEAGDQGRKEEGGADTAGKAVVSVFEPGSYDLVFSSLSLHWINNLPGALAQINRLLKPDCAFLGAMLGGDSLFELRTSLQLAEQERRGGLSPHVSPLADVRDMGGLLQRAGFTMLTVDVDDIVVDYPDSFALMTDLQAMGESNAVLGREMGAIRRDVLLANDAIYRALHGNPDGSVPATFRIIYMIGWHPSANQPKPLPRGSGQVSLKDVLEQK